MKQFSETYKTFAVTSEEEMETGVDKAKDKNLLLYQNEIQDFSACFLISSLDFELSPGTL